jgi:hypothetical protein
MPPAASTWRGGFARGLSNRSPLTLVAGLAAAALALAGLQWFVTSGAFTLVSQSHLLRLNSDDWGRVSYQVGHLKRDPPRQTPVYLLGGSNMRESVPSQASLAMALKQRTGMPVDAYDFGSNDQTMGETMAIIDNLPRTGGVVVIAVNQTRLSYSPDEVKREVSGRQIVLLSHALAQFMARHGDRIAHPQTIVSGILSYLASYVQTHSHDLLRLRLPTTRYELHRVGQHQVFTPSVKQLMATIYLRHDGHTGGTFDKYFSFNAALLDATVRLAKQRGFIVVLMEAPENREIVGSRFDRLKGVYQPLCRALAARDGAHYVNFVDRLGLVNDDFRDLTHLTPSGRSKWQRGLVDALAPLLTAANTAAAG